MIIVQISDMHVTLPGRPLYGKIDTHAAMQAAVAHIVAMETPPDVVIATGDLVHEATVEGYAELLALLKPIPAPVYVIPGNHDDRAAMREALAGHDYLAGDGFVLYAIDDHPVRIVGLDTIIPGKVAGALCRGRLEWLESRLAEAPDTPTLVLMHHPPFETGVGYMDRMGCLEGAEELGAIIQRNPQVERVLCGHDHRPVQTRWHGTIGQICPSTAHQMYLTFDGEQDGRWLREPAGCLVHRWAEGAGITTHLSYIGDYGPAQEFGKD